MRNEINLLPEKYRNYKRRKKVRRMKVISTVLIMIIAAAAIYVPIDMVNDLKNMSIAVENEIMAKKDASNYRKIQEELQKDIEKRNRVIDLIQSKKLKWSEVIAQIGQQVPEGIALSSINYGEDGSMEIVGQAAAYNLVAQLMVNVQNMKVVNEVHPVSIVQEESGLYGFNIKCTIQTGSDANEAQ